MPPVETPTYEQGQDEISEMKQGTSEPPVPDTGRSKSSFNTGTTRIKGRTNQRPEPPKVHEQGREPPVEDHLVGPRDAAARHTGYQTRSAAPAIYSYNTNKNLYTAIYQNLGGGGGGGRGCSRQVK